MSGRVPDQVLLHHVDVALLLHAASHHLQDEPQPAVHGAEVRLDEDRGQAVPQQRLLHQEAQLVLLFRKKLEAQVRGPPDPADSK